MNEQTQHVTIECVTGDIVKQSDLGAIVNAANAELQSGGGVAGAIHRAAGAGLAQECAPMAPIAPGEAVLSSGQKLPNEWVIHCLGPVYGKDEPADQLLANCYRHALRLAEEKGIARIGFPAISTGAFGYPAEEAARVCAEAIKASLPRLQQVECIRFVLFDSGAKSELQAALERAGLVVSARSQ